MNSMKLYSNLKDTPIAHLVDSANGFGQDRVAGVREYREAASMGLLSPQVAYPFLDFEGRYKIVDRQYGPSGSGQLTAAQVRGLVYHTLVADAAQALHTSGKLMGLNDAQKKQRLRDQCMRIQKDFRDAASNDGTVAQGFATSRTTEFVEPRAYVQVKQPFSLASGKVFPIITEGGAGAEIYTANYVNRTGQMGILNNDRGNDLPIVTANVSFVRTPIVAFGASYSISVNELAVSEFAAQNPLMAGVPSFNNLQLEAAVEAYMSQVDQVFAYGIDEVGLPGLFNNPDITPVSVAQNAGGTSTLWDNKTQNEILADVFEPLMAIAEKTGGSLVGTMACFTQSDFQFLATTASNDFDKKPFLAYFRQYISNFTDKIDGVMSSLASIDPAKISPEGQMMAGDLRIVWSNRFVGIGGLVTAGTPANGYYNGFMVYSGNDESALKGVIPLPMTTLAPQWQGLNMVTPFWTKIAGTISRYPDAVQIRTGQSISYTIPKNELRPTPIA